MKCEYCDNEVPAGVSRCPSCGAVVAQPVTLVIQQQTAGKQSNMQPSLCVPMAQSPIGTQKQLVDFKSKSVFALLGIFLGGLGIHNFYLGHIGRGVAKLLITILSFGWLCWVSWIWGIVEVCTMRMDAKGRPLV